MASAAARVSLTMIVHDEQVNLPACLASVEAVFDEIVVVDTGSADRTKEIAREFGATCVRFRLDRRFCGGAERGAFLCDR